MDARRVVFYGNNLHMSAIAACLQEKPEFKVSQIQGMISDILKELNATPPDVIVFDSAAQPEFPISLLKNHPTMMLVGVDLTSSKMQVFSGQQSKLLTAEDLMKVIETGSL